MLTAKQHTKFVWILYQRIRWLTKYIGCVMINVLEEALLTNQTESCRNLWRGLRAYSLDTNYEQQITTNVFKMSLLVPKDYHYGRYLCRDCKR